MIKKPSATPTVPGLRRRTKRRRPGDPLPAKPALRKSALKYRCLHESLRDAFVIVDMSGRIQECNQAYCTMLGYTAEELAHLTHVDLTPEKWHAFEADLIARQIIPRGYSEIYEKEYRKKDGTIFPVELRTVLVRDKAGQPSAMWAMIRDITARKQVEAALQQARDELETRVLERTTELSTTAQKLAAEIEQHQQTELLLRESEERYRAVVEGAGETIATVDANGVFLFMNSTAGEELGGRPQDFIGKTMEELFPPEIAARQLAGIQRAIHTGQGATTDSTTHVKGEVRHYLTHVEPLRNAHGQSTAAVVIARDITARRLAELAQRESEEKYHRLFDTVSDAIQIIDAETLKFIDVNRAAEKLYGYSRAELLEMQVTDVSAEPEATVQSLRRLLQEGSMNVESRKYRKKDGTTYFVEIAACVFELGCGRVACGVVRDITERRQAEEALRASEARFDQLAEQNRTMVWEVNAQGLITYVSRVAQAVLGYGPDELIGKKYFYDLHPAEGQEGFKQAALAVFDRKERVENFESRAQTKDGRVVWISTYAFPLLNEDGTLHGYRGTNTDITQGKLVEDALQQSEVKFRSLIEHAPDGIVMMKTEKELTYVSPSGLRMFGIRPENLPAIDPDVATHPADLPRVLAALAELKRNPRQAQTLQYRFRHMDGRWLWVESVFTNLIGCPGIDAIVINFRNISDRKEAENALKESEARADALFEDAPLGYHVLDNVGRFARVNRTELAMLGYSAEEMLGQFGWDFLVERDQSKEFILACLAGVPAKSLSTERTYRRKDGTLLPVRIESLILHDAEGRVTGIRSNVQDITARKQAEDILARSEKRLREAQRIAHIGYWERDLASTRVICSDETCRIFGLQPQEGFLDFSLIGTLVHPEDLGKVKKALNEAARGGPPYDVEYRVVQPGGAVRYVHSRGELSRDESGKPARIFGTVIDITKQIIQAREKEYLASFPTLNPNPVIELDREGRLHYQNPITGGLFPDLAEKTVRHEWLQNWDQITRRIWAEGQAQVVREIWQQGRCYEQHFFHIAELDRVRVYGRDITERKQAEQVVQDNLQRLQEAQRLAKLGHWTFNVATGESIWSPELCRIMGWQPDSPPPSYENHRTLFTPESWARLDQAARHTLATGEPYDLELELINPDGRHAWIQDRGEAVRDDHGRVVLLRGTAQDITERIQARRDRERYQRKLQAMAGQVLLAEESERRRLAVDLHDGLGQTLTLIRMKLGMMRQAIPGTGSQEKFREIELLLDEALSTTGTLTFQLSPPVLYELGFIPAVYWLAEEMERRYGLHIQIDDPPQLKPFSNQIGIILFRCVRELLVNVAKHARVKEVRVSMGCDADRLRVAIEDHGVGFEPQSLLEKSTRGRFGLFSIEERMTQLGGQMAVRSGVGRGTSITLTVPLETAVPGAKE